jgi:hypothetical protein
VAGNGRKKPTNGAVIDHALAVGLQQAAQPEPDFSVRLPLTQAQRGMVLELCSVLGLSARSLLNAALSYALHRAEMLGVPVTQLDEFPRRLTGEETTFELTVETLAKAREAGLLDSLPRATVAGIKLLHGQLLAVAPER